MAETRPVWSGRELPVFFRRWRAEWKDEELSPSNYLDFEGGLRFVLAAAWLFCPETVEYRGCVFLKENFCQGTVDNWFTSLGDDRGRIEAVVNQVSLRDVFINTSRSDDDQLREDLLDIPGRLGLRLGVFNSRSQDSPRTPASCQTLNGLLQSG
ncbi:hypothetical protein GCM10022403_056020 [Streptomyces coacervatus]|uniref:Uncharacterized protein n=1 Tax=Streptomyces coacervatus TaxID=647381 RepID=A0ABP7ICV2_9ACTN|nr:hypothetical protein [Streptomyces coacervatus]MDF2269034.1 hypothetical protein [Streptomyces coacervatus]